MHTHAFRNQVLEAHTASHWGRVEPGMLAIVDRAEDYVPGLDQGIVDLTLENGDRVSYNHVDEALRYWRVIPNCQMTGLVDPTPTPVQVPGAPRHR